MPPAFIRAYPPAQADTTSAIWLPFRNGELLLAKQDDQLALFRGDVADLAAFAPGAPVFLGTLEGVPCVTCDASWEGDLPDGWQTLNLRSLYGQVDDASYNLAGYATQLLYWQKSSGFCAVCGSTTDWFGGDWGKRCTNCGHTTYPHVSPAILALVHDGDNVLLTHKPGWGNRYSIIAGFVEPGESLEECVKREVYEEAGLEIDDVTYFGSQSWPFPHQLMVGFLGRYTGNDIAIDDKELDDAKWFHVDALPELPGPSSLSRQIIDGWIASRRPKLAGSAQ